MTGKNGAFQDDLLAHYFENAAHADVGDAAGLPVSVGPGNIHVSLHTADPDGGTQNTSEHSWTGYGRIAIARSGAAWNISSGVADNAAAITWAEKTAGGDQTATHAGLGFATSGATDLYYSGVCSPNISVANGVIPEIIATALTIDED